MAESYRINGTDLSTVMHSLQTLDGFVGVPQMRQDDFIVPGRTGSVAAAPWIGPRPVTVGGLIRGDTRAEYQANLRRFASLCFNDGRTFTLSRQLAGDAASVEGTARYVAGLDTVEQLSDRVGRVAVEFSLLTGVWLDSAETDSGPKTGPSSPAGFALQVPGDATTSAVRVQFSGSSSTQTLWNATTGDSLSTTANTTTDPVTCDVSLFTATQLISSVIGTVSANATSFYWMTLRPGPNTFLLTGGGTVRLYWKSAWL